MSSNGRRREEDPVTERDPETQESEVAQATEDEANQPGRLMGTFLLFRDLWRLFRGEENRTRKIRWRRDSTIQSRHSSGQPFTIERSLMCWPFLDSRRLCQWITPTIAANLKLFVAVDPLGGAIARSTYEGHSSP